MKFVDILKSFCENTNLHGFSYIVQPSRWKIERLFWMILLITSFALTCSLTYKLILENQQNPTIIYTDQNVIPVTEILFPSVTFSPGLILKTKARNGTIDYEKIKTQLENREIEINNLTMAQLKRLQIASLIARDGFVSSLNVSIPTDDFVKRLHEDFLIMWKFKYLKNGLQVDFKLNANWTDMYSINVTEVLCKTGLCYTFNFPTDIRELLNVDNLSNDFNYKNYTRLATHFIYHEVLQPLIYPLKGPKDSKKGLYFKYKTNRFELIVSDEEFSKRTEYHEQSIKKHLKPNITYTDLLNSMRIQLDIFEFAVPKRSFDGLLMLIHGPYEMPSEQSIKFSTTANYDITTLITPRISSYDETFIDMNVDERLCYIAGERSLKFFNAYNKINCEHECLANQTLKSCNCTQFFMVREQKTRICGAIDEECYLNVENNFINTKDACKCYELCEKLTYDLQKTYTRKFSTGTDSKFMMRFAVDKILPTNRKKQNTIVGFLSLVGGFLGLFAGFSVLSGIEILYFFIIEPILKHRRKNKVYPIVNVSITETKSMRRMLKNNLAIFLNESSIHGFNHVGNAEKSIIERLIWLILFIIAMIGSYFMVIQVYSKLNLNQIMMTLEGREGSVDEIPFPAITFNDKRIMNVPLVVINNEKKFFSLLSSFNSEEFDSSFEYADINTLRSQIYSSLCDYRSMLNDIADYRFDFKSSHEFVDFLWSELDNNDWFDMQNSTWNGNEIAPYAKTLNSRGISYTFNIVEKEKLLDSNSLSRDFNYDYYNYTVNSTLLFPWSTSAGGNKGLFVDLINLGHYGCFETTWTIQGPNELPISADFNEFRFENAYDILIIPELVNADDDLKSLTPDERQCYYSDERKLKYFKIYTKKNCEMECLSHIAYNECNCVPFYFIRDVNMTVCEYGRFKKCASIIENNIQFAKYDHLYELKNVCKCHPDCNSITYNYEVREFQNIGKKSNRTTLTFRYKNAEYFALMRYRPFKLVDFLSYVGGILGFFAGISVLSIFEIFYYFTLKLTVDLIRHFRRKI